MEANLTATRLGFIDVIHLGISHVSFKEKVSAYVPKLNSAVIMAPDPNLVHILVRRPIADLAWASNDNLFQINQTNGENPLFNQAILCEHLDGTTEASVPDDIGQKT